MLLLGRIKLGTEWECEVGWIGARCISIPSQPFCSAADVSMGAGLLSTRHIPICPSGNDPWVAWLGRLARCTSWSCRCLLYFPSGGGGEELGDLAWLRMVQRARAWVARYRLTCARLACQLAHCMHASQGFVRPPSGSNHTRARSRLERQASAAPRFAARADETSVDDAMLSAAAAARPFLASGSVHNKRFLASSRRGRAQPVQPSIGPRATSERDGAIAAHSAIALARLRRPAAHCTPAAATHSRKGRILPTTPPLLAAGAIFENFPVLARQTLPELAQTSLLATLTALR